MGKKIQTLYTGGAAAPDLGCCTMARLRMRVGEALVVLDCCCCPLFPLFCVYRGRRRKKRVTMKMGVAQLRGRRA